MNAMMGLPVVAGLLVYLLLSRAGPLGELGFCSHPAMVIAQAVLIVPIIAALARQVIEDSWTRISGIDAVPGAGPLRHWHSVWDKPVYALVTVVLAGLGGHAPRSAR
jgi:tungstate transport system permease protein